MITSELNGKAIWYDHNDSCWRSTATNRLVSILTQDLEADIIDDQSELEGRIKQLEIMILKYDERIARFESYVFWGLEPSPANADNDDMKRDPVTGIKMRNPGRMDFTPLFDGE